MDYLYIRIENAEFDRDTPERAAFHDLLMLVANALHDIEWVDSGDKSPGAENAAILAALGTVNITRKHHVEALEGRVCMLEKRLRSCWEGDESTLRGELAAVEKRLAETMAVENGGGACE